ncbi:DNA repair protein XRCC1-like [Centruroides sculpturatus]|uniref:DNA repair protein XRCC1-like n=1 Tax=Centruroides sculpturatus TaxID=218467 RepID=UPI000C6D6951|nr:DNA repair protein XRCC1-like [Centruroides sculpturatus]
MPEINFKHIISFSSEDKVHKAENLLRPDTFRKWKCSLGEKQASIVIQLEKSSEIHSIDIGNENSAFVEVLVGRSEDPIKDFKVLLVTSSFMSPMESKNSTNINRVRMFGPEKLSKPTSTEKWDLVKIVCTQPFNKTVQFGLSFIKLHSPPEPISEENDKPVLNRIGSFRIKDDDEAELSVGSWFAKRNEKEPSVSGAAAVRDASSLAAKVLEISSKQDEKLKSFNSKTPVKQKVEINKKSPNNNESKQQKKISKENAESTSKKRKEELEQTKVPMPKKPKTNTKDKPFNKIMKKVLFVLSGFQNPFRGELRDKAIEMGAKYKGDWEKGCTHLVCAFMNTPKYNQVKSAGGRIVNKDWILDCYKKQTLLPWRNYILGQYKKDSSTEESEDEVDISVNLPDSSIKSKNKQEVKDKDSNKNKDYIEINSDEEYAASTDVDSRSSDSSGSNTEDEIRKVQNKANNNNSNNNINDFKVQTRPDTSKLPLPELPSFFKDKCFFLYGNYSSDELHTLQRYIIAFHGSISNYMNETVNFVVTNAAWDDNFNDALEINEDIIFVKPQWIYDCTEKLKHIPYQRFVVVPT